MTDFLQPSLLSNGNALLKSDRPLVPLDSVAGRALMIVIAILTFLAALSAGGAHLLSMASEEWQSSIAREATIQIKPHPQRDMEADLAMAASVAKAMPQVANVTVLSKQEAERLLEPWLGKGLDFSELPVPRLIVLQLVQGQKLDTDELKAQLASLPNATFDDHRAWAARLSAMANTVIGIGVGIVVLVMVATAMAVAFATRGAVAGAHDVVEVLHFVGANDDFIAREFQGRFLRLGLKGGLMGTAAAVLFMIMLSSLASSWRTSPSGEQIEALFGTLALDWRGYGQMALITLLVAGVTAAISRLSVRRYLSTVSSP